MPRGRFTAVEAATVVGANPTIEYPAGPAWCADPGAQCVEPPLGLDNPALEPSMGLLSSPSEVTGEPTDAPSSTIPLIDDVEPVGSPLSSQPNPASTVAPLISEGRSNLARGWAFLLHRGADFKERSTCTTTSTSNRPK